MAATDHPIVLDLGSVVGPTGPRGPSGVATTSGTPSSSVGSDGDVMIDPDTGIFYKKTSGTWSAICTAILAPLDTEIDDESTKPVTNAAIADALDGKIDASATTTSLEMAGSGTFDGTHAISAHGPIAMIRLATTNRDPTVWNRTINIGLGTSATPIATVPEAIRPNKTMRFNGQLLVEEASYWARFEMYSKTAGDGMAGKVIVTAVYDEDNQRIRTGGVVQTQFVATGYDVSCVYFVN